MQMALLRKKTHNVLELCSSTPLSPSNSRTRSPPQFPYNVDALRVAGDQLYTFHATWRG